ncbi:MAG: FAD-dependent oxidoreductase [Pseudomonadota bacterium]|nr:FAD-dependent oxidoreductase [Pseudomonadota bacterium]
MTDGAFLKTPYHPPGYLPPAERVTNHYQALQVLPSDVAQAQAGRCVQCDVPGCNSSCPVGQKIPQFLKEAEKGNWPAANQIAIQSPLYGLFGQICPQQEGLCESSCTVAKVNSFGAMECTTPTHALADTIAIGGVEAAIWRKTLDSGSLVYPTPLTETGKTVAIIGAGPAGIYAATEARKAGHSVKIYDAWNEVGGLLLNGIPNFKLDKKDLPIVRQALEQSGVHFKLNTKINDNGELTLQNLLGANDAVLIATGTYADRGITNPDKREPELIKGHEYTIPAMRFLIAHNDHVRLGVPLPPELDARDKRVVVVGPRDTGMDVVGNALRDAVAEVTVLQRHATAGGALKEKLARGAEARVLFDSKELFHQAVPLQITAKGDHFELETRTSNGGRRVIEADMIIRATGFEMEDLSRKFAMTITPFNNGTTNIDNLFVAGDARNGATLAVTAAQDGRRAAYAVNKYLRHLVK